jgi:hypothetical protein
MSLADELLADLEELQGGGDEDYGDEAEVDETVPAQKRARDSEEEDDDAAMNDDDPENGDFADMVDEEEDAKMKIVEAQLAKAKDVRAVAKLWGSKQLSDVLKVTRIYVQVQAARRKKLTPRRKSNTLNPQVVTCRPSTSLAPLKNTQSTN